MNKSIAQVFSKLPRAEHANNQWRISRLDNVRDGFDVRHKIERVGLGRLVVDDVGFRVRVGHGEFLL